MIHLILAQIAPAIPAGSTINFPVSQSGFLRLVSNPDFYTVVSTVLAIIWGAYKHQKAAGLRAVLGETVKGIESSTALQPFEDDVKSAIQKAVTDKLGANGEAILHSIVVSEAAPVRAAIDKALASPPPLSPTASVVANSATTQPNNPNIAPPSLGGTY